MVILQMRLRLGTVCFLIMGAIIGIIIVCLTVPKQQDQPCQYKLNAVFGHRIGYNSRPRSAVVIDINNDHTLDIVVANSGTDNVGIFFGFGNGTFQSQITYATGTGSQPYAVIVGDFNNDNRFDIVSINHGTHSIGVLLGYGNGTFKSVSLYSLGSSRPISATTAHLNNDIYFDIILLNYDTSSIDILLGYGNGSFGIQTTYLTGYDSHPCFAAAADLNSDNQTDIIVANWGTNNVAVFLGNSNGMFSLIKSYSTGVGSNPSSVAIGDVNGDHQLDIIVSNYGKSTINTFLGNGDGTFAKIERSSIGSGLHPFSMVIGDFNNDNILDVAVANSPGDNIIVLYGSGNGTFVIHETHFIEYGARPVFITAGHFNKDDQLDLATINNGTNEISVFLRYYMKTFGNQTTYFTGQSSLPAAVALGDFNNDSILDTVVVNQGTNNIGIFLGYENGTFAEQMIFSTGNDSAPYSVTVGDFNKDSLLDVVVANQGTSNIGIFLGYGNGTFAEQMTFSTGSVSFSSSVAVGDFNKDSLLDVVVTNVGTSNIGIFLGYGNGTFAEQMVFPTGDSSGPWSIAVGDFNRDNHLDVVVANVYSSNIGIFLGYGNGTFAEQMIFSTGSVSYPYSVAVGDFNNDTFSDIAVANHGTNNVGVLLGCGNGSFGTMTGYFVGYGSQPSSVVIGDFNNDFIADIAVSNYGTNNVAVIFGFGNGSFGIITYYSTTDGSQPNNIAAGHLNNDIYLDIIVVNYFGSNVGVLLGSDIVGTSNQETYKTGSGSHPYSVVVSDFNNDNRLDLLIANSAHDNVGIRLGYENGIFGEEIIYSTISGSRPLFATAGDFNNDHKVDIVIVNTMSDSITVAYGSGNGTFINQEVHSTGYDSRPQYAAFGDLNNDGRMDLATVNHNTDAISVFLSFHYATFEQKIIFSFGSYAYPISIVSGDFNQDSLLDMIVANYWTGNISIFLGYGNGTFTKQNIFTLDQNSKPRSVAIGDFNNDSLLDIVVANEGTNNIGIFLGYGNGSFARQTIFSTGNDSAPYSVAVGDFNKDRLLDIVVANEGTNNIGIFLGYGNGTFTEQMIFPTGDSSGPFSVAVGDFNEDNFLDVIVANFHSGSIGIFLGYANGSFARQMIFSTGNDSNPRSVAVGDFNKDSFLDVVVANMGTSSIGIFLGYGNGNFTAQTTYTTGSGSQPYNVILSDLNGDNRLDAVVTNSGAQNIGVFFGYGDGTFTEQLTFPAGQGSQPFGVVAGDFNCDNLFDIGVADGVSGNISTFIRNGSQFFLSMTTYSTGKNSKPQSMIIEDFDNDNRLDIIVTNYGYDNIGIFLGYDNGTFKISTTFSTGSESKPYAITAGHLNNDNLLDVVVANDGISTVSILMGHGNGTFSILMTYTTGYSFIPHSIVLADFDNNNYLDIAVANFASTDILMLFGFGNGTFGNSKSYLLGYGSLPTGITAGDFNNDSWIDIAVANYGTDTVDILLQVCNKTY